MKKLSLALVLLASPAAASSGLSFSLSNTNFIVLVSFLLFIGVLLRFKVPHKLVGLLDARAAQTAFGVKCDSLFGQIHGAVLIFVLGA